MRVDPSYTSAVQLAVADKGCNISVWDNLCLILVHMSMASLTDDMSRAVQMAGPSRSNREHTSWPREKNGPHSVSAAHAFDKRVSRV